MTDKGKGPKKRTFNANIVGNSVFLSLLGLPSPSQFLPSLFFPTSSPDISSFLFKFPPYFDRFWYPFLGVFLPQFDYERRKVELNYIF